MAEGTEEEEDEPAGEQSSGESSQEVPPPVVDEVEQLTRQARKATDDRARDAYFARRERVLEEFEFRARVREDDRDTLVLYPDEWVEDGTVQPARVDDVDRGIERPLEGPGDPDDWDVLYDSNLAVAERVRDQHGDVHGDTARALAEFMSNHHAKPIGAATDQELTEFVEEYFPRNAWPSDKQREQVDTSLTYAVEVAEKSDADE